ncbi:MAG TPA: hypothetical protein VL485_26160 [Ktedonobacteraceae bacterium]|jgi:hypothetical protein|nr:hypothetical protein [Ktedonobacteraceae bacterium]
MPDVYYRGDGSDGRRSNNGNKGFTDFVKDKAKEVKDKATFKKEVASRISEVEQGFEVLSRWLGARHSEVTEAINAWERLRPGDALSAEVAIGQRAEADGLRDRHARRIQESYNAFISQRESLRQKNIVRSRHLSNMQKSLDIYDLQIREKTRAYEASWNRLAAKLQASRDNYRLEQLPPYEVQQNPGYQERYASSPAGRGFFADQQGYAPLVSNGMRYEAPPPGYVVNYGEPGRSYDAPSSWDNPSQYPEHHGYHSRDSSVNYDSDD